MLIQGITNVTKLSYCSSTLCLQNVSS